LPFVVTLRLIKYSDVAARRQTANHKQQTCLSNWVSKRWGCVLPIFSYLCTPIFLG